MSREFKIVHEGEVPGAPEQAWEAMTTGIGGWLWPMEIEGREGGSAAEVPAHRLVTRMDEAAGSAVIESRPGPRMAALRPQRRLPRNWDSQRRRPQTVFYMPRQYITSPASPSPTPGDGQAAGPDALGAARELGLGVSDGERTTVRTRPLGTGEASSTSATTTIGVRTSEALIRFPAAMPGAAVGLAVHDLRQSTPSCLRMDRLRVRLAVGIHSGRHGLGRVLLRVATTAAAATPIAAPRA
jgi:hypothetical protein